MKKILLICSVTLGSMLFGQDVHKCFTHEALLHQDSLTPGYITRVNETFERAKLIGAQNRSDVYTIPVVVHVVYENDAENIPDSVIFNQIESLNADYRRLNEDAVNVRDTFNTIVGDTFIEFQLAVIDPDGNPTTGITRTETDVTSFFDWATFAEDVKQTATGGIDAWDQSRYLNIWICDMSFFGEVFLLGYATPPDGLDHWPDGAIDGLADGVVLQYETVGSNNPNPLISGGLTMEVVGRTLTHEVGHYLGLRHIWGDGGCSEQDGIDDTPNMSVQSSQDCDLEKNTCVDDIEGLGDLPDMVENYMDYSAETCQNSFTQGQVDMMRSIIENYRGDLIEGNPALGIDEKIASPFELSIYPNPSKGGEVTIAVDKFDLNSTISIYAESGQQFGQYQINATANSIALTNMAPGLYFVRVDNEAGSKVEKLIIY